MLKNVSDIPSQDFSEGLSTFRNIFNISKSSSPNMKNVKINIDGSIQKRLGSNKQSKSVLTDSGAKGFSVDNAGNLEDNMEDFWPMDESSDDRVGEFAGIVLADNNSVPSETGILANAALFQSASTHFLQKANTANFQTGDIDFSISSWVWIDSSGKEQAIISKRDKDILSETTKLLIHADGSDGDTNFTDSSESNHSITANGNAQKDTAEKKFGTASALLDGSGDYLSIPDSSDWAFGSNNWTIDFWVRTSDWTVDYELFNQHQDGNNFFIIWTVHRGTNDQRLKCKLQEGGTKTFGLNTNIDLQSKENQFIHIAVTYDGTTVREFADGNLEDSEDVSLGFPDLSAPLHIGKTDAFNSNDFDGHVDEFRIVKGTAVWTSDFTPPTKAYIRENTENYEYHLAVDDNDIPIFAVSSSGMGSDGLVRGTSIGSLDTATWYNVVAWHDTGDTLGISVNLSVNTASYSSGLRVGSAPLTVGSVSDGTQYLMDGRIDEWGFWKKVLSSQNRQDLYNSGDANRLADAFPQHTFGAFDFGASEIRWFVTAAGTGLFASSDLGANWTAMATDRTATYNHFTRSKNILVCTTDQYDPVLRWDGSGGTFAQLLNPSAPTCRFSENHQGFTILMNSEERKRIFAYEDVNTHITGDWADNFDLPSTEDDEITGSFVLRNNLYVSLRNKLFRLSFVGGNPDWTFTEVKSWGFVPRTIEKVSMKDIGEVAMGLTWDKRIRIFDGSEDKIVSDSIEEQNSHAEFALDRITRSGSGLTLSHAVFDPNEQEYRLCVGIGQGTTQTTHTIHFNARNFSFYPYDNQQWQAMARAQSNNQTFILAGDRSGHVYLLDSGNLDKNTAIIDDFYDSPFIFEKTPSEVTKAHRIDFYFDPSSEGTLTYLERLDFDSEFIRKDQYDFSGTPSVQFKKSTDISTSYNMFQYRLTSSMGTTDPWILNRVDFFGRRFRAIGDNP